MKHGLPGLYCLSSGGLCIVFRIACPPRTKRSICSKCGGEGTKSKMGDDAGSSILLCGIYNSYYYIGVVLCSLRFAEVFVLMPLGALKICKKYERAGRGRPVSGRYSEKAEPRLRRGGNEAGRRDKRAVQARERAERALATPELLSEGGASERSLNGAAQRRPCSEPRPAARSRSKASPRALRG